MAACILLSTGLASTSFAEILWVASIDSRLGYLPVYAEATDRSPIVGSLQRCTRVVLTGAGNGPWVEISTPMQGWVDSNLLSENSCSTGYVEPGETTVIGTTPIGTTYVPHWRHRHHRPHHVVHHRGGHHPGGHHPGGHHPGGHHPGGHHAARR